MNVALDNLVQENIVPLMRGYGEHICIIDVPNYPNVGDSAIFLGELAIIRKHFNDSRISFFDRDTYTSEADVFINECSIILLHGGGNFGDTWPIHNNLRKTILRKFSGKRIIQLPQSINFSDRKNADEMSKIIQDCTDFHLVVRDKKSESFARDNFSCNIILAPDSAFCMGKIRPAEPEADFICLLRRDLEAVADHEKIIEVVSSRSKKYEIHDWISESESFTKKLDDVFANFTRKRPKWTWHLQSVMLKHRERYARERLQTGIAMLGRGEILITDRLHAHILACLLRIPHVFLNPLDSKIEAFYRTWTYPDDIARFAASPAELDVILGSDWLLKQQSARRAAAAAA